MSTGKKLIIGILLLIVVGSIVGYMQWNKPHAKVEDVAGMQVSTEQLANDYAADEQAANGKYLEKVITVTGTIIDVKENQDGFQAITLDNDIQCTMRDKTTTATASNTITVKGFCNGADLFGVVLSDCIVIE